MIFQWMKKIFDEDSATGSLTITPKLHCEMKKLDTLYNPVAKMIAKSNETVSSEMLFEQATIYDETGFDFEKDWNASASDASYFLTNITNITEINKLQLLEKPYVEPKTFQNAWWHLNPYQREILRAAIKKECGNMSIRQV